MSAPSGRSPFERGGTNNLHPSRESVSPSLSTPYYGNRMSLATSVSSFGPEIRASDVSLREMISPQGYWNPHLPLNPRGIDLSEAAARVKKGKLDTRYREEDTRYREEEGGKTLHKGQNSDLDDVALREMTESCLRSRVCPSLAVFYSGLLYSRTELASDALTYAKALAGNDEPKRAVCMLEKAHLLLPFQQEQPGKAIPSLSPEIYIEGSLLASQCLVLTAEYDQANSILEQVCRYPPPSPHNHHCISSHVTNSTFIDHGDDPRLFLLAKEVRPTADNSIHPIAALCNARGQLYDHLSNPARAKSFLKAAVNIDLYCIDAFHFLLQRHLFTEEEAFQFVHSLAFQPHHPAWLTDLYFAQLPQTNRAASNPPNLTVETSSIYPQYTPTNSFLNPPTPTEPPSQTISNSLSALLTTHRLHSHSHTLTVLANRAYTDHDLPLAASLCSKIQRVDPHCPTACYIHAASLLTLKRKRQLYHLAHTLTQSNPRLPHAWFAVGCYYLSVGRYDLAQRHFCWATRLDPRSSESWIGFGCAFAFADESDQALAAFRTAHRLHPSSHIPLLYIGMEYLRTNHLSLSLHFLEMAEGPPTPLLWNEMGVVSYAQKRWEDALRNFLRTLKSAARRDRRQKELDSREEESWTCEEAIRHCRDPFWEPTVFNLGQTFRKLRQMHFAILCFEKAITLCPGNATSYAALGYTQHLSGDIDSAIENYHRALGIKPEDTFSGEMLHRALEESLHVGEDAEIETSRRYGGSMDEDSNFSLDVDMSS